VYSTLIPGAETKAMQAAEKLRAEFEKRYRNDGKWDSIDLRECRAEADTSFSVRDLFTYKQWRLEHVSMKQSPPEEFVQ
jgi:hypothetical protein